MKKIGITGNIASGKSTVEKFLKDSGYNVIDADNVCHELINGSQDVIVRIKKLFEGHDVLDEYGFLSRRKIGEVVFASEVYRKKLESIIHPCVIAEIEDFFRKNQEEDFVFASVPLLFEAGLEKLFDKIIFVSADEKTRFERLMKRNNFSKDMGIARISAQKNENDKIKKSDFVIYNNGNLDELFKSTKEVLKKL